MKKLFTYSANNGGWNGYHTKYIIAESPEEVMNSEDYIQFKNFGYSLGTVREVTSEDICLELSLFGDMGDKITFSYEIKEE